MRSSIPVSSSITTQCSPHRLAHNPYNLFRFSSLIKCRWVFMYNFHVELFYSFLFSSFIRIPLVWLHSSLLYISNDIFFMYFVRNFRFDYNSKSECLLLFVEYTLNHRTITRMFTSMFRFQFFLCLFTNYNDMMMREIYGRYCIQYSVYACKGSVFVFPFSVTEPLSLLGRYLTIDSQLTIVGQYCRFSKQVSHTAKGHGFIFLSIS